MYRAALQEQKNIISRMDLIKIEREEIVMRIEKVQVKMSEFEKYIQEKEKLLKAEV